MTTTPRVLLILSENWTLAGPRDLMTLVRWAQEAEDSGVDGIMLSEHIVLGGSAGANGVMANGLTCNVIRNVEVAVNAPSVTEIVMSGAVTEELEPTILGSAAGLSTVTTPVAGLIANAWFGSPEAIE